MLGATGARGLDAHLLKDPLTAFVSTKERDEAQKDPVTYPRSQGPELGQSRVADQRHCPRAGPSLPTAPAGKKRASSNTGPAGMSLGHLSLSAVTGGWGPDTSLY